MKTKIQMTYKMARRMVVAMVGGTVLLVGIALLVLPGPAFVVIPAGLAILSLEFAWAKHWLHKVRDTLNNNSRGALNILRRRRETHEQ